MYLTAELSPAATAELRERAIFEYMKFDQQVGDVSTCFPRALVVRKNEWNEIAACAEALSMELLEAERTFLSHPSCIRHLGLPRPVARALVKAAGEKLPRSGPRLMRFDFHWSRDGWRISEANSDVPGGLNETSCYPRQLAPHFPEVDPVEDVTEIYADALIASLPEAPHVGLVHATAYTDDRQVMMYLASRLRARGAVPHLLAPDAVLWSDDGRAAALSAEKSSPLNALARFFPAEWLPNLPKRAQWRRFYSGSTTPLSNPAHAILSQSKRAPWVWKSLGMSLPTWEKSLPECLDLRELGRFVSPEKWVVKPALGRVGEHVGVLGACSETEWNTLLKLARRRPQEWIAQERFDSVPIPSDGVPWHVCLGLYTVDGRSAGAYGRISDRPRIDKFARDVAVFVERGT